jgi:hypothetical protein
MVIGIFSGIFSFYLLLSQTGYRRAVPFISKVFYFANGFFTGFSVTREGDIKNGQSSRFLKRLTAPPKRRIPRTIMARN